MIKKETFNSLSSFYKIIENYLYKCFTFVALISMTTKKTKNIRNNW